MTPAALSPADLHFIALAFREAKASLDAGGLPIGSVLARGAHLIASGHNQRVQHGDPIAHGEMDCLRKAGRQTHLSRHNALHVAVALHDVFGNAIVQFKIPARRHQRHGQSFGGNEAFLRSHMASR